MKEPREQKINFQDLVSKKAKVKYGCAKRLLAMAKDSPDELYPYIDRLIELLNNDNQILEWTAIDIVGYLSRVDAKKKIDCLIERLFGLLGAGKLITANHAIGALAHIAVAKPRFQKQITEELLSVEHYDYETGECWNIAVGKVILAMGAYADRLEDKSAVIAFLKRQAGNTRNATKKKAERLLRKLERNGEGRKG